MEDQVVEEHKVVDVLQEQGFNGRENRTGVEEL